MAAILNYADYDNLRVLVRFIFNGENHLNMMFAAILNSVILIWASLIIINISKYTELHKS